MILNRTIYGILGFIFLIWVFSPDQGWFAYFTQKFALLPLYEKEAEVARNIALVILGVVGLPLALWRSIVAQQQINIAQTGQYSERYAKAASMLSEDELSVREAGVFSLKELAVADPEGHYFPVQNLLCAFVRDRSRSYTVPKPNMSLIVSQDADLEPSNSDIIEALRAFSDLRSKVNKKREREIGWKPDLKGVWFVGLPRNSRSFDLSYADLDGAYFSRSKLELLNLYGSIIRNTVFSQCVLKGACFISAKVVKVDFTGVNLEYASFHSAELAHCIFDNAKLMKANFAATDMSFVKFIGSNLKHADLKGAQVFAADFTRANFKYADLKGASFSSSTFNQTDLGVLQKQRWPFSKNGLSKKTFISCELEDTALPFPVLPREVWPPFYRPSEPLRHLHVVDDSKNFMFYRFVPIELGEGEKPRCYTP